MTFRAFIAVEAEVGPELRKAITKLKAYGHELKPVPTENVHITLKFLGDVNESIVPQLECAIRTAAAGIMPFPVRLSGVGAFPNANNPKVVWAGMQGGEWLGTISASLEGECEQIGIAPENRPFSPHLTLARVREGARPDLSDFLNEYRTTEFNTFMVERISLKKSVLTPNGPIYSDVITVDL